MSPSNPMWPIIVQAVHSYNQTVSEFDPLTQVTIKTDNAA